jgi:hypothetical protein
MGQLRGPGTKWLKSCGQFRDRGELGRATIRRRGKGDGARFHHVIVGRPWSHRGQALIHHFHAAALRAGGRDNGAPGLRSVYDPDYYAAFIIDPDGYRIEAYYGPEEK